MPSGSPPPLTPGIVVVEIVIHKAQPKDQTAEEHPHTYKEIAEPVIQQKDAHPVDQRELRWWTMLGNVSRLVERIGLAVAEMGRGGVWNGHVGVCVCASLVAVREKSGEGKFKSVKRGSEEL